MCFLFSELFAFLNIFFYKHEFFCWNQTSVKDCLRTTSFFGLFKRCTHFKGLFAEIKNWVLCEMIDFRVENIKCGGKTYNLMSNFKSLSSPHRIFDITPLPSSKYVHPWAEQCSQSNGKISSNNCKESRPLSKLDLNCWKKEKCPD